MTPHPSCDPRIISDTADVGGTPTPMATFPPVTAVATLSPTLESTPNIFVVSQRVVEVATFSQMFERTFFPTKSQIPTVLGSFFLVQTN